METQLFISFNADIHKPFEICESICSYTLSNTEVCKIHDLLWGLPFQKEAKKRSGEKKMRILLLKLVGPGLSRSWLITLIGLLKNLKQANHNKIANKRVFLIKILYNYFFGVPSSPADQYDTPFVAFHVVNFFVCRPHHFGTILKVPIHVNSLKKVKNMGIFCFQFPVVNRE